MRLCLLLLAAGAGFAADWADLQRIAADHKIEVRTQDGSRTRAAFVSVTGEAIVVREQSGVRSIPRADVREVRVADPGRRGRNGAIWTAVGAGTGAGIGFAICPHCGGEGARFKFMGPLTAVGAGIGALSFLVLPYRTVYKN